MSTLTSLFNEYGQSPWIDNIRRDWLNDGTLKGLVAQGVRGVTSNPSIFAKALATSSAYDEFLAGASSKDPETLFEALAVQDVKEACDILTVVYEQSKTDFLEGRRRYLDGFVSLEVSPHLARDAAGTIAAAKRLANEVGRSNVMIKIPATREGLPAVTEVLGSGINVNVTLIFSLARYNEVIDAWLEGLELAKERGHDLREVASVASFFVSRLDVAVDALLEDGDERRGTIANAQVCGAYQQFKLRMSSDPVKKLLENGAQIQRPLWASTSTKNPTYPDLLYVDPIVGDETVNTMPDPTLDAVLDHADFTHSLLANEESIEHQTKLLGELPPSVSLADVTERLEVDGVNAFVSSYDELLATVAKKIAST